MSWGFGVFKASIAISHFGNLSTLALHQLIINSHATFSSQLLSEAIIVYLIDGTNQELSFNRFEVCHDGDTTMKTLCMIRAWIEDDWSDCLLIVWHYQVALNCCRIISRVVCLNAWECNYTRRNRYSFWVYPDFSCGITTRLKSCVGSYGHVFWHCNRLLNSICLLSAFWIDVVESSLTNSWLHQRYSRLLEFRNHTNFLILFSFWCLIWSRWDVPIMSKLWDQPLSCAKL